MLITSSSVFSSSWPGLVALVTSKPLDACPQCLVDTRPLDLSHNSATCTTRGISARRESHRQPIRRRRHAAASDASARDVRQLQDAQLTLPAWRACLFVGRKMSEDVSGHAEGWSTALAEREVDNLQLNSTWLGVYRCLMLPSWSATCKGFSPGYNALGGSGKGFVVTWKNSSLYWTYGRRLNVCSETSICRSSL